MTKGPEPGRNPVAERGRTGFTRDTSTLNIKRGYNMKKYLVIAAVALAAVAVANRVTATRQLING